jgi:GNAT superfamily N-acetyltransferase
MTSELHGLRGGVPGMDLSPAEWAGIVALYGRVWPRLPDRIRHAEALGARWAEQTTPFTWFEHGRALAHVGVLEHPVRLAGTDTSIAGFHAVCTDPDHRGRGLCRRVLQAAIEWASPRFSLMKLSTAVPQVYESAGFVLRPTHHFALPSRPVTSTPLRRMDLRDAADLRLLRDHLARRVPISDVFATRDPGWLILIDAALAGVTATWFHHAAEADAIVVGEQNDTGWDIDDLITPRRPPQLPPLAGEVVLRFTPDLVAPDATPVPVPAELMVRGPWPELPPFGVPALWEH